MPPEIKEQIKRAANRIKRVNAEIRIGCDLDKRLGSDGRYEADAYRNMAAERVFADSYTIIERYRSIAESKGINYVAFLDSIKLEALETLSSAALQWTNR